MGNSKAGYAATRKYFKCMTCGYAVSLSNKDAKRGPPRCLNNGCIAKTLLLVRLGKITVDDLDPREFKEYNRLVEGGHTKDTAMWILDNLRSFEPRHVGLYYARTVGTLVGEAEDSIKSSLAHYKSRDDKDSIAKRDEMLAANQAEVERVRLLENSSGGVDDAIHSENNCTPEALLNADKFWAEEERLQAEKEEARRIKALTATQPDSSPTEELDLEKSADAAVADIMSWRPGKPGG